MNWKEELKKQGFIVMLPNGRHASNAELELQYFISTQIIKKLIERYNNLIWNSYMETDLTDMKAKLKQEVEKEWL